MSSYRYIFLNSFDQVADYHVINSETDTQAQARANRLLAAFSYPSIKVWDRDRMMYRARKPNP